MTMPAEVTSPRDWHDMVLVINQLADRVNQLTTYITELPGGDSAQQDQAEQDLQTEREAERRVRDDFETDFDLDGDLDPAPHESNPDPDMEVNGS